MLQGPYTTGQLLPAREGLSMLLNSQSQDCRLQLSSLSAVVSRLTALLAAQLHPEALAGPAKPCADPPPAAALPLPDQVSTSASPGEGFEVT